MTTSPLGGLGEGKGSRSCVRLERLRAVLPTRFGRCAWMVVPGVLAMLALLVGGLAQRRASRSQAADPPVVQVEVPRSQLELRDGRLHLIGSSMPFVGVMLDRYPDGSLQSRSSISNGLLHGVSEGWYASGPIQVCEPFREGVAHGVRTKWYTNGNRLSEAHIVAGQLHGLFRRWHESGQLAEEVGMNGGRPDGIARAYFPSGFLKSQATLKSGEVLDQQSWEDGVQTAPTGGS